jgi:hypothetical protein
MANFHLEYQGARWRYGSLYRPHMNLWWNHWIIWSDLPSADFPTFGTMDSSEPIHPEQAERWGLVLVQSFLPL